MDDPGLVTPYNAEDAAPRPTTGFWARIFWDTREDIRDIGVVQSILLSFLFAAVAAFSTDPGLLSPLRDFIILIIATALGIAPVAWMMRPLVGKTNGTWGWKRFLVKLPFIVAFAYAVMWFLNSPSYAHLF